MGILVFMTGGTIGAMPYYEFKYGKDFVSTMPPAGQDFVREAIEKDPAFTGNCCISYEQRDSKLMDEPYRLGLLKIAAEAPEKKILITHGTDTLLQSAEFFYRHQNDQAIADKVILITGAMIPLANGPESDGYLNLKFSLEQLSKLSASREDSNIYIVLCDYEKPDDPSSAWKPKLYQFYPGQYEKAYAEDRRFSRLRKIG